MELNCEVTKTLSKVNLKKIVFDVPNKKMYLIFNERDKPRVGVDLKKLTAKEKTELKKLLWWAVKKDPEITESINPFEFEQEEL